MYCKQWDYALVLMELELLAPSPPSAGHEHPLRAIATVLHISCKLTNTMFFIISQVAYVWNFVGSIGGTLILFILPPVFYLRLRHMVMKEEAVKKGVPVNSLYRNFSIWRDVVAFLILVLGVVLMIVENYVSIYALVNAESHQSLGQCQQLLCNLTGNLSLTD